MFNSTTNGCIAMFSIKAKKNFFFNPSLFFNKTDVSFTLKTFPQSNTDPTQGTQLNST